MVYTDLRRQEQLLKAVEVPETIATAHSAKQSVQDRILFTISDVLIETGYALRHQIGAHTYRRKVHYSQ